MLGRMFQDWSLFSCGLCTFVRNTTKPHSPYSASDQEVPDVVRCPLVISCGEVVFVRFLFYRIKKYYILISQVLWGATLRLHWALK